MVVEFALILVGPDGGVLQVWRCSDEAAAVRERDRLKSWPALRGDWSIMPLIPVDAAEPTPPAPSSPVALPVPYIQPQPVYPPHQAPWVPQWPYIVWCDSSVLSVDASSWTPEQRARWTAGATAPEAATTFTIGGSLLAGDGLAEQIRKQVQRFNKHGSDQTLNRICEELGDDRDDEDPPAAVAAKI